MGQQPNIEVTEATRPRSTPQPPPARSWRGTKPGVINSPDDVPRGGMFGVAAPDGGWAMKIIGGAELPEDSSELKAVLAALMTARAGALGRGPTREDLEMALVLCGYGFEAASEVIERRERWKRAVHHDLRPGETAVSEVDLDIIVKEPEQVRRGLSHTGEHGIDHS